MAKLVHVTFGTGRRMQNSLMITECINAGLDVEVWNVGPWLTADATDNGENICKVTRIFSTGQFRDLLASEPKDTFFNLQTNGEFYQLPLYREFGKKHKNNASRFLYEMIATQGAETVAHEQGQTFDAIKKSVQEFLFKALNFSIRRLKLAPPQMYAFVDGAYSAQQVPSNTILFPINSYLYEQSMNNALQKPVAVDKYAVFIDQNFPYHPDYGYRKLPYIAAEPYYAGCNAFFDHVEEKLGMPVVIAAHPTADLSKADFGGRTAIKGETLSLVKHASLVLAINSTAASSAIIHEKPIWFLYNQLLVDYLQGNMIFDLKSKIDQNVGIYGAYAVNMDDCGSLPPLDFDKEKREKTMYDFLTWPHLRGKSCAPHIRDYVEAALEGPDVAKRVIEQHRSGQIV
jgi:hypothetical protein